MHWVELIQVSPRIDPHSGVTTPYQATSLTVSLKVNPGLMPLRFSMEVAVYSTSVIHVLVVKTTKQIRDTRLLCPHLQLYNFFRFLLLWVFLKLNVYKMLAYGPLIWLFMPHSSFNIRATPFWTSREDIPLPWHGYDPKLVGERH